MFCVLVVTAGNYLIYGHVWEGSLVRYDPYALFLNVDGPRPTVHNTSLPSPTTRTIWMFGGSTMRSSTKTTVQEPAGKNE